MRDAMTALARLSVIVNARELTPASPTRPPLEARMASRRAALFRIGGALSRFEAIDAYARARA